MRYRERGGVLGNLLLLAVVAGGGAAYWWYDKNQLPPPIDPVRTVKVVREDVLKAVLATGRIDPEARVDVMSRASGILKQLFVEEGDVVHKDDVLAELDREQLQAQHAENLANQAAAKARLDAAKARLDEAKVKLVDPEQQFAVNDANRMRELVKDGSVNQKELDDAELRLANVTYRLEQVKASIPVLDAGVGQAQADLDSAIAAVDRSQTSLREATIRSQMDGLVIKRIKEVGDGVSSILTAGGNATKIMTLADTSKLYVKAKVDEVDVGKAHVGMRAVISSDSQRERTFEGEVVRIAPAGTVDDNGIVSFEVKVLVDDPEHLLKVDMTANTRLVLEQHKATLALPQKAIRRTPDGGWTVTRVVSLAPPVTEDVKVEVGVSDGLKTEIVKGVAEGDRILLPSERPMEMR